MDIIRIGLARLSKQALGKAMFQALNEGLLKVENEKLEGRTRKRLVPRSAG